jgi:predicted DNA-binding protein (UPF0251 family)
MARTGIAVTVNGTEYKSASDAARALSTGGMESSTAIAKTINEAAGKPVISPQTVVAALDKNGKVKARHANYQALRLASTGKYTVNQISERAEISRGVLAKLLEGAKITCPTRDELNAKAKAETEEKAAKLAAVKAAKPAKVKKEKAPAKSKKAKKVAVVAEPQPEAADHQGTESGNPTSEPADTAPVAENQMQPIA